MRRNAVLSTYNRATYLDQTLAIMQEKHAAKSFICMCDLHENIYVYMYIYIYNKDADTYQTSLKKVKFPAKFDISQETATKNLINLR